MSVQHVYQLVEQAERESKQKRRAALPAEDGPGSLSDDALATRLAFQMLDGRPRMRRSPGLEWMIDIGPIYVRDDRLRRFDIARAVCRAAAADASDREGKAIRSARTVNAVVSLAASDPRISIGADEWDCDPFALNTPEGIVDLRTGSLRPRHDDYLTQVTRCSVDFEATCPVWLRFLDRIFLGDVALIDFVRRSLGYMLTGDRREQVLFFLQGSGGNGKSVFVELVQWINGNYALKLPASVLMQAKGERHPTELAQLRGKRLAVSSEIDEGSNFNESLIKELTGDDVLTARYMRQDFFEFRQRQKHVIVGNYKPRLRGGDPAIARRMLLVPFLASFTGAERDPEMLDKLKAEAPAILAWMVSGAIDWHRSGLAVPPAVRDASAEYLAENDDLMLWIDECCVREGETKALELYESFAAWKSSRGEHVQAMATWGARMAAASFKKRRSNGWRYIGLRLSAQE